MSVATTHRGGLLVEVVSEGEQVLVVVVRARRAGRVAPDDIAPVPEAQRAG